MSPSEPTLATLTLHQRGRVREVLGNGPAADRLRELGLTRGTTVELLRQAPFGGPMIFALRGYQLCLRPTEAARVLTELGNPTE
ncbi:MAG: FeoA family protein [Planctomycetota bacterium]|jgi:ferrous iron transport protein A|nr:FeoA family protein [Planctomycetota bacterium]MDP6940960.1 FeoA family protein [Planctomycetota bacterium]